MRAGVAGQKHGGLAALALALAAVAAPTAQAAPADLDPSFSQDGIFKVDLGGTEAAEALARQADGKLVAAGRTSVGSNGLVLRVGADGTPDPSFGSGGKVTLGGSSTEEAANGVAIQGDGKILVAGRISTKSDATVHRLNANGTLDTSFDGDGLVVLNNGGSEEAVGLAVQPDGKIVVAGQTSVGETRSCGGLQPNGALDSSFDGDGKLTINASGTERVSGVVRQPDGRIVVSGSSAPNFSFPDAAAFRLNANGSLDTSFSGDGKALVGGPGDEIATAVALQPDGKIVLSGTTTTADDDGAVFRLTPSGALDPSFDGDGIAILDAGELEAASDVAVQPDGKIVATLGYTTSSNSATVFRLDADGSRDAGFGTNGMRVIQTGSPYSEFSLLNAVLIEPDGRIVAGGFAAGNALLLRLLGG